MSVERRGNVWRVRWRDAQHHRARTFTDREEAEAFARTLKRRRRGRYSVNGQPCIPLGRGRVALVDAADVERSRSSRGA